MSRDLIFVDVETTGLKPDEDRLVELSYAKETGDIKTLYFGVYYVPPFIDDLIGFTERGIAGWESTKKEVDEFLSVTKDQTMVSANPKFDAGFLETNNLFNFHYRTLDIESYAMAKIAFPEVPGMFTIYETLVKHGFKVPEPRHTSASDVDCLRTAYNLLRWQYPGPDIYRGL